MNGHGRRPADWPTRDEVREASACVWTTGLSTRLDVMLRAVTPWDHLNWADHDNCTAGSWGTYANADHYGNRRR